MNKQQFYDAQMSEKSNTKNTNLQENVVNSQPKQEIYTDITFESPYEIEYDNPSSDSGPQVIRHDEKPQTWKYGVFDCFANWRLCLLASFAPCVPFGETSKATTHGECLQWQVNNEHRNMTVFFGFVVVCNCFFFLFCGASYFCIGITAGITTAISLSFKIKALLNLTNGTFQLARAFLLCHQRIHIRHVKNIEGTSLDDFSHAFCCHCCTMIQQARESGAYE